MRIGRLAGAVILAAILSGPAQSAEPKELTTEITAVTVYADRAQVTRTGSLNLATVGDELVINGLPGWIDQESVRVTLTPASRGKIRDVAVEKTFLAEASADEVRKADASVREIEEKLQDLEDERRVLNAEIKQLEGIRAYSMERLPRETAIRPVKPKAIGETIDFISNRLRGVRKAMRELERKRRDLHPELAKRQKARNELRVRAQLQQSRLRLAVEGSGKTKLTLTYLTPGAAWEPVAEIRTTDGGKAKLIQSASVMQTTGEDWSGAKLSFSTQRPGETLKVPEAKAMLLGGSGQGIGGVLGRMGESFNKAEVAYAQQNKQLSANNADWNANLVRQQQVQQRAVASFQKLLKRGTTAHFEARAQLKVRADGRAVRVPITEASFAVENRLVAVPEVSLNAVRTAKLVNTTQQAILPGNLALFVDGAFVGKSQLDFVAPGESFSVFLGVNDAVKLERVLERNRSGIEQGRKRTELTVSFVVSAENLSDDAVTIDLTDRIPVVQTDEIELDDLEIPRYFKRSGDGLVRWTAKLKPKQKQRWRIKYTLEYPTGLPARAKANAKKRQINMPGQPAPAAESMMLFDQIEEFEEQLK